MNNLFSTFSPMVGYLSLKWMSLSLVLFIFPASLWTSHSFIYCSIQVVMKTMSEEMKRALGQSFFPGALLIPVSLFVLILFNNMLGLFPYVFTGTSHLVISMSLGVPIWLGHIMLAWSFTPLNMFTHLTPAGSPILLAPFMVCIELISSLIRPLTLSIRLVANITAGHLLLTLLSSPIVVKNLLIFCLSFILIPLVLLETAVAFIQSYVFSLLSSLYISEVDGGFMNLN